MDPGTRRPSRRFPARRLSRRAALGRGVAGAAGAMVAASGLRADVLRAQEAIPVSERFTAATAIEPPATPEGVAAAVGRLDDLVRRTMDETGIPGMAVAVVHRDEVPYLKGVGVRRVGEDGAAETIALTFLDDARFGEPKRDYRTLLTQAFAAYAESPYGTSVNYEEPPADAAPPLGPAAYAGTYAGDLYGPVSVEADGDGLVLRMGPDATPTR